MKKVLLIEDDNVLRENTAELLELSNYKVIRAADGVKGIQQARISLPDIIVCDIMMPAMDGYKVLENLSDDQRTRFIPFIFLSAKTERKDVRKGMELGADDYITKPFEESELIGAIESRLAKASILKEMKERDISVPGEGVTDLKSLDDLKSYVYEKGSEYQFRMGESIYREGDHSNKVYLILKGAVKTHKLDEKGKEFITGIFKADDLFGLTSFTDTHPHSEYASAIEHTTLAAIKKEELKRVLEINHHLIMELLQLLAESLTEAREQLLEMAYGSVRRKTASTLLKFADKLREDEQGGIHILRSDLAGVAGMATETLIRTLSTFKKEGLIDIRDRNIKILDIKKLKTMQ